MRYTEHPYQKNGFASIGSGLFAWGGMENQTLTSICSGCWEESLIGHEFAHQWFGDLITCATWADIWLNEGFATWCEANWEEYTQGYPTYKSEIDNYAYNYMISNPGWAISVPEWAIATPDVNTLFNYAVTYEKGACALHQLRYLLTDTVFFTAMRSYASDTNFRFKNASVADFNAKINEVSGNNYDWYFTDWIFQPNQPTYNNTYNFQDLGNGQWKVNFFTYQEQSTPAFFRMMLEIKVNFSDNSDTTFRFMNDQNYQSYTWTFAKHPVSLVFDPGNNIVLKQATTFVGVPEPAIGVIFLLLKNIPNPATGSTKIIFETSSPQKIGLEILDVTGKTINSTPYGFYPAGQHTIDLNCTSLAPGVYYYKMTAGKETQVRKMIIVK
jgi:aminopeptidase N